MQQQEIIKCPNCGSNNVHREEELYVCDVCGTHYRDDGQYYEFKDIVESQLENFDKRLEAKLLSFEETEKGNLRQLLLREIEKDKFNSNYVIEYCEYLLKIDPNDIVANYFDKFCKRNNHSRQSEYIEFIKSLSDADIDEYDEQLIVTFMVSHVDNDTQETIFELLQNRGILSEYNDLLDKSYKNYKNQYALYSNIKRKVFICHKSQDKERVDEILIALEKEYGFNSCWISERNLPYDTTRYNENIQSAIENCEYFLVVTSEKSMYSKDVQKEMDYASKHEKPCIEYILDEESKGIARTEFFKQYFDGLQWIDGSQGPQYQEIIKKIEKLHIEEINKSKSSNDQQQKVDETIKKQTEEIEQLKKKMDDNERRKAYAEQSSNPGFINIPSGVIEIKDGQYRGNKTIQIVQIPKSVKRIGKQAFKDCQNLEKVIFEEGSQLEIIGEEAFCNCNYLIEMEIPFKVTAIESNIFSSCSSLQSLTLPIINNHLGYYFGANKFYDNAKYVPKSLKTIVILGGTSISKYAFADCSSLINITIPSSVTSIEEYAFYNCSSLQKVYYEGTISKWVSINFGNQDSNPLSINKLYINGKQFCEENINLEGINKIGQYAFYNCKFIKLITIPSSVTCIDKDAFEGCRTVEQVNYKGTISQWANISFNNLSSNPLSNGKARLYIKEELQENINLKDINRIGQYAFYNCKFIKSITISSSVTSIETSVFTGCDFIETLTLPSIDKYLGYYFGANIYEDNYKYVPKSLKIIVILGGTNISKYAFADCSSLINITIPSSVTCIECNAFYECTQLKKVIFKKKSSLKSIKNYAFSGCSSLKNINLPNTIKIIENNAFNGCKVLSNHIKFLIKRKKHKQKLRTTPFVETIDFKILSSFTLMLSILTLISYFFAPFIPGLYSYWLNAFYMIFESETGTTLIFFIYFIGIVGLVGLIVLSIMSIKLILKTKKIGIDHYYLAHFTHFGLTMLFLIASTTANLMPNSAITENIVTDAYTLHLRDNYNSYTIVGSEKRIFCEEIDIVIPFTYKGKPIVSIGDYAFSGCSSLTNITIPSNVTSIGDYAFSGCSSLTSITIPDSVTSIGEWAFHNCSQLQSVTFEPNSKLESIGDHAFGGCSSLITITIPSSVTSIGEWAFYDCSSLTSITIPSNVTSIGEKAFWGCNSLESLTLPFIDTYLGYYFGSSSYTRYVPESLKTIIILSGTSIPEDAFYKCSSLRSITIPSSVTSIGEDAFYGCSSLQQVDYNGTISKWACINFSDVDANPLSNANAKLYINGKLFQEENIVLEGIDKIGAYAFYNCSFIKTITIPSSVTSIEKRAFFGCNSLESLTLPFIDTYLGYYFGATKWQNNSDYVPKSLKTIVILGGTSISKYAFADCSSLINITIPSSVTSIEAYAFYNCSSLKSITIPNSVTSIGSYAFSYCSSLESITIPSSVTSIGSNAFRHCTQLQSVTFEPNSKLESIGSDAFWFCSSLTSIIIPSSVTTILDSAFDYCNSLTIYCEASSKPNGWNSYWNYRWSGGKVYWGDDWHYENGVPTLN